MLLLDAVSNISLRRRQSIKHLWKWNLDCESVNERDVTLTNQKPTEWSDDVVGLVKQSSP